MAFFWLNVNRFIAGIHFRVHTQQKAKFFRSQGMFRSKIHRCIAGVNFPFFPNTLKKKRNIPVILAFFRSKLYRFIEGVDSTSLPIKTKQKAKFLRCQGICLIKSAPVLSRRKRDYCPPSLLGDSFTLVPLECMSGNHTLQLRSLHLAGELHTTGGRKGGISKTPAAPFFDSVIYSTRQYQRKRSYAGKGPY